MHQNNNEITPITDVTSDKPANNSSTMQVSGVIFNEIPSSSSNLSFQSKFQLQDTVKRYKSVTNASNQFQIHSSEHLPSKEQKLSNQFQTESLIDAVSCDVDLHSQAQFQPNSHSPVFDVIFVPSQTLNIFPSKSCTTYNPLNSFTVNNADCDAILLRICNILCAYSADIEYKVNSDQIRIDGVIFMTDHNLVFFMISVSKQIESDSESDQDDDIMHQYASTVEFVRKQGDSISFTRFWCDIREIFLNGDNLNSMHWIPSQLNAIAIDVAPNIANELNSFYEELNADNEYMADFMRIFIDSHLGNTIKESDIIQHKELMQMIVKQTLYDRDISITRGALIILIQLIEKCEHEQVEEMILKQYGFDLMQAMIYLLNKNESVLIHKYVVKLLSKLNGFCLNCNGLQTSYRVFEEKWKDLRQNNKYYAFNNAKDILTQSMFNQIESMFNKKALQ